MKSRFIVIAAGTGLLALLSLSCGAAPEQIRQALEAEARNTAGFPGFSAERGRQFFQSKHGAEWSCSTCHTDNPTVTGRHARTSKDIAPLAPSANAERFSDAAKVEKWFRRNCNDVVGRLCSAQEKGDVLTYLMSLKK
jgi:cytochrome c553